MGREEVLNVETLRFIGCYGDVHGRLCWRCETGGLTRTFIVCKCSAARETLTNCDSWQVIMAMSFKDFFL